MKAIWILLLLSLLPVAYASPMQAPQTIRQAKAPLGDLSKFRLIASDTLAIVKTGKLTAAAKRITDLETAWDVAQVKLKPMNPSAWRKVDLAIDTVLYELRADKPKLTSSQQALEDLIHVLDSLK